MHHDVTCPSERNRRIGCRARDSREIFGTPNFHFITFRQPPRRAQLRLTAIASPIDNEDSLKPNNGLNRDRNDGDRNDVKNRNLPEFTRKSVVKIGIIA